MTQSESVLSEADAGMHGPSESGTTYPHARSPGVNRPATAMAILCLLAIAAVTRGQDQASDNPVVVDYFFEPGCTECEQVRAEVLPVLQGRLHGLYTLRQYDMSFPTNVARLVAYQEALGVTDNEPVSMVVDYRYVFAGIEAIRDGLPDCVEAAAMERFEPDWKRPQPIDVPDATQQAGFVAEHVKDFALLAVIGGGLVDGINPCAISTLVFFMSLLAVAKVGGRGILAVGVSFCTASFLTYTALGFGLLRVLHTFTGFPLLRLGFDLVMILVLILLAWLSFRDAWRYRITGRPDAVTLQLPNSVKERIHRTMRTRLKTHNLVCGGFLIGVVVTALESVCTGQVYVPTLVVVIKSGNSVGTAWSYLLLYNAMFITPLVCVFLLTYGGLKTQALLDWSKRNVVTSKCLLGLFFAAMAALIGLL